MAGEPTVQLQSRAADDFNARENRQDGLQVVRGLADGLTLLKNLAFRRVHHDVESAFGVDSMLMPLSAIKSGEQAMDEIDLFNIAEATLATREYAYIKSGEDWFADWLTLLRFGARADSGDWKSRRTVYLDQSAEDRRLKFGDVLAEVFPECRKAPLVLFRLLPLAARIATALAFGDHGTALDLRRKQLFHLPSIEDCQQCHGGLLDNGDQCRACGNPVWDYEWLTAPD
jgi:hypothetical protein